MRRHVDRLACKALPVVMALFFVSIPVIPCIYDEPEEQVEMFPAEWLEYKSGMPCDMASDIEKQPKSPSKISMETFPTETARGQKPADISGLSVSEEAYEQETGGTPVRDGNGAGNEAQDPGAGELVQAIVPDETQVETAPASDGAEQGPDETPGGTPDGEVVGDVVPSAPESAGTPAEPSLCDVLRQELETAGIGWWYPYAWAQVQQESHWNPNAVNANGLDFGLLQYRLTSPDGTRIYWTGPGDIMDPYAQIRKYVGQVAARLNAGLSIEETISRHMTSDYVTEINWDYVNLVLSHLNQ